MKQLLALMMCALSLGAAAQFPNLPYNPDDNGDGFIGVYDLQSLLAMYGSEFASALLSNDSTYAVMDVGATNYFSCSMKCSELPGDWTILTSDALALVYNQIYPPSTGQSAWLDSRQRISTEGTAQYVSSWTSTGNWMAIHDAGNTLNASRQCFCSTKQVPRVQYDYCLASTDNVVDGLQELKECVDSKLMDGWQLLGPSSQGSGQEVLQTFWRWAE